MILSAKINNKTTKSVIIDYLKETETRLEAARKEAADPTKGMKIQTDTDVVVNAADIAASMQTAVDYSNAAAQQFLKLTEAIAIQEAKLKDLYDIEAGVSTLMAMSDTHAAKKAELELEHKEAQIHCRAELDTLKATLQEEKLRMSRERSRELESYEYGLSIKKRDDKDAADAEIRRVWAEVEEKAEELVTRDAALETKASEIEAAEDAIIEKELALDGAMKKAVAIATSSLKRDYENEKALTAVTHDGLLAVATSQVRTLEDQLAEAARRNCALEAKLETAYEANSKLATDAVTGGANKALMGELLGKIGTESASKK